MSVERELGRLSEAVEGLKKGQDGMICVQKATNAKLDAHLEKYSDLRVKVTKIAGAVSLLVSLFLIGVKTAVAKLFN